MIFNVKEIVKKKKLVHHENYLIYNKWLTCPLIIPHLSLNLPHLSTDNTSPHPWFLSIRPLIMPRLPLPISHLTPTIPHFTLTMPYLSSALPPAVLPTLLEPVVPVRTNDAVIQPCPVDIPHCILPFFPGVVSHKSRATTLYVVINETLKQMFIFLENL